MVTLIVKANVEEEQIQQFLKEVRAMLDGKLDVVSIELRN